MLQGKQRGNKTTNRNSNQFVVLRFACMSWTFLWLVTKQSTILQYFRHSQFSEFSCKYFLKCVVSENIHTSSKDGSSVYIFPTPPPPGISRFASYFRLKSLAFETPFPSDFPMTIFGWVCIFSGITPFVYCNMMQRPHCMYMYIVKMQIAFPLIITVVVINVLQCRYWLYMIHT